MFDVSFDVSKRSRASFHKILGIGFLLVILLAAPLLGLITPASAAPTTVLTAKWTRINMGTNWEGGLVIGDVTGDGQEDVVYCGGGNNIVHVLDGDTGDTIANYSNGRIGTYTMPQLYDVDGDDVLDILVPLYYEPGLAAVRYDGDSGLSEMWEIYSQGDQAPGGEVGSGTVMAKPVAGDIDGDGDLDIFLASQDVSYGDNSTGNYSPYNSNHNGYDGTIIRLDHEGNIVNTTFTWRACSGGLSLGDTDNDGVFELYQGDRDMDYTDGGYGKGAKSYWADDLTERWIRLDDLTSSQAPVLADVNGDGILDAMAGMYSEQYVFNSTNGAVIYYWSDNDLSVHYGTTIYDIDGDGHLELLTNDGDHDDDPYTDVFDLVTGEMDAQLPLAGGDWKWSPLVADIDPTHPGMEIISCPNGTSVDNPLYPDDGGWRGAIFIFSSDYESLQNITRDSDENRLSSQLGYPVVQDIDGDGLLELVTHSSSGRVYAFDTEAPAPGYNEDLLPGSKRIRSEVTYFGEARLGVAEHTIMPWEEDYWTAPLVAPVSPSDNALAVPVSTSQLSFKLREHQSEPITYTVTTSPDIGSDTGSNSSNSYDWSTYNLTLDTSLTYDTTYRWTVTADDGTNVTSRTYTFRTEMESVANIPPEQGDPLLESDDGLNSTTSTFLASNQSTTDDNGHDVTNIYRWMVEDEPVAKLHLPFDLRNETSTKDYAYGNNGTVVGATWVPDGIVGGAYMFDGKDDAIIISDGGDGYFNDKNYTSNHEELGGFGNWNAITVEAWIYLTEYTNGSRVVAKIPSYALGFESHYTSRLYAAVWPMGFEIADDDNQASRDRERSVEAYVDIDLNTWYHIAFTYESGVGIKLYLNGEMVRQSSAYEGPVKISRGEPVYIGRLVQPFAGMIDEVRVCSYAQPKEQIYTRYMESKDGSSSSSMFIPIGAGFIGDELECRIIPTDSYDEGTTTSASVILQNSLPNATDLEIYPIRDRAFRLDDEDLTASYEYVDPDGDAEAASKIEWYLNGASLPAFENVTEIPAASTAVGQKWNFTITPQDSLGDFGVPRTSYTITIRDNVAPTTDTPDLVSSGGENEDDEDLIASAVGSSDTDGDSVTNIYRWTLEEDPWMNLLMPFDTETQFYSDSNSTTNDYSGYGNDGTVVGATWREDGVVGGAYAFDGDDYIRVEENANSLGGDGTWSEISIEFWVKATTTTSNERLIWKHDYNCSTSSATPYGIGYRVDFRARSTRNEVTWYVYTSSGYNYTRYYITEGLGDWHHVVCTYNSSVGLKIHVDGTVKSSTLGVPSGNINATLDGILDIGYGGGSVDFRGMVDGVGIYPHALTSAQIFQRFIETKDGLSNSSTIVYQETADGDDWAIEVTPNDSWEDGTTSAPIGLHVDNASGNGQPRIDWYSPVNATPEVNETEDLEFMQVSSDPDGDTLTYNWTLDSTEVATTQNWNYTPASESQGIHTVRITVTDGLLSDYHEWTVNVINVEYRNLTVLAAVNGVTDPEPGTYQITLNTNASVSAIPDAGYELDHWLLNASEYGSANPAIVNMTDNFELEPVFAEGQYNLTVNIVGNGTVTVDPDLETYSYGVNVSLTAVADADWVFVGWSGDASGSELTTTVNMTDDMTVTATFTEVEHYTLTVNVEGDGIVTVDPDLETYLVGTNVNLTAVADADWVFVGWSGDASGTELEIEVPMDANKTITATFLPMLNLEIAVDGEGTTNPAPGTYEYLQGTEVEVDAIPNEGFKLSHWLLNETDMGDADPYTVTMDADYVLTAVFVSTTFFEDGFESGDFSQWGGNYTTSGEMATVVSNLYHHGLYGARFTTNGDGGVERAYLYKDVDPQTEVYIRGYFNIQTGLPLDATDNRFNLFSFMSETTTIASMGVRRSGGTDYWYINSNVGSWNAGSGPAMEQWYCVEFYILVDSTSGIFRAWVNGEQVISQTGLNTATVGSSVTSIRCELVYVNGVTHSLDVYGDCVKIANSYIGPEAPVVQYELAIEVVGNGITVPASGSHLYDADTEADLAAYADPGWVFSEWSGDLTGSENPTTILMDENKTVTATFIMEEYTLTVNIIGNGTVDLNATGPYYYGDVVELTANPDLGWNLSYWLLDDVKDGNDTSYMVTMNSDHNLTAVFVEIPQIQYEDAYLVVRGLNDRIYYRIYNASGSSWEGWNVVPNGATCDSPAAALYSGKLYIVVRGMDGQSLWFGWINLTDNSFSDWTRLTGATPSAPTLARNDSQLILVVRGMNNRIYYRSYNCTSDEWEGWIVVPTGVTCDSPAATILANELHIVVRGISAGNRSMWHGRLNLTTEIFLGWTRLSGATPSAPTLAASQTSNRLCLTVRGLNNSTYYNTWNGTGWEGWTVVPNEATCDGPASTLTGDELHIVVRGMDGYSLWHCSINLSTTAQLGWTRLSGATPSTPTLTS